MQASPPPNHYWVSSWPVQSINTNRIFNVFMSHYDVFGVRSLCCVKFTLHVSQYCQPKDRFSNSFTWRNNLISLENSSLLWCYIVYRRFEGFQYLRNAQSYLPVRTALHRRLENSFFWNTTLCRAVYRQYFRRICCIHLQSSPNPLLGLLWENWPTWTSIALFTYHILQIWPCRTTTYFLDWKNNWKFAIFRPPQRSLLPRRPSWTDKLTFFLSGLQKLEQEVKMYVEHRGEYVE
jgi:hypothetical protein